MSGDQPRVCDLNTSANGLASSVLPVRYVTLCVVVQQGGEAEGDRPCGCPQGEVPATLPAAFSPPGKGSSVTMWCWLNVKELEMELVQTGHWIRLFLIQRPDWKLLLFYFQILLISCLL